MSVNTTISQSLGSMGRQAGQWRVYGGIGFSLYAGCTLAHVSKTDGRHRQKGIVVIRVQGAAVTFR